MSFKEKYVRFYDKHYKKLLFAAIVFFAIFAGLIVFNYIKTGELFQKGVSLKGGSIITVQLNKLVDVEKVQTELGKLTTEEFNVREFSSATGDKLGFIVETTLQNVSPVVSKIKSDYDVKTINVETVGPKLGQSFFRQMIVAILIAFILMALVVFVSFRVLLPSAYIILSAVVDVLFSLAMVILLNVKISAAGIAAFLMLIGYSVDTDILLTTRVLKAREGATSERIYNAMSTGIVMTLAAMAATGIAYIATPSEVLKQIMMILFFGLMADLPSTWFQNAGLLKLYVEKKQKLAEEKAEEKEEEEENG